MLRGDAPDFVAQAICRNGGNSCTAVALRQKCSHLRLCRADIGVANDAVYIHIVAEIGLSNGRGYLRTHSIAAEKGMKRRHCPGGVHLENRASAARAVLARGRVEVSVAALDQPAGMGWVWMELMQHLILLASRGGSKKRPYPDYKRTKQIPPFHNSLKASKTRELRRPD